MKDANKEEKKEEEKSEYPSTRFIKAEKEVDPEE